MVDIAPGNELAFVEAQAIVEQQFNVCSYEPLAETVDGLLEFVPDFFKTIDNDGTFFSERCNASFTS